MSASGVAGHLRNWQERWRGARIALLSAPSFQQWAGRFPLTRRIARRRALGLFDLCAGFVYSQVLSACAKLGLFERLAGGACALGALARELGLNPERLRVLIEAAASLQLLGWDATRLRVSLGTRGAEILGTPGLLSMIRHHALLYADLAEPAALLRERATPTRVQRFWGYAASAVPRELSGDAVRDYSELMSQSQALVAGEVCAAYPLRRHRVLMDLGGGEGGFATYVAQRIPHLQVWCVDLPAVQSRAAQRLQGLGSRVRTYGCDFIRDPLPEGADVVTLLRVLHDHDDAAVERLVTAAHAALSPGGTLLVAEPMVAGGAEGRVALAYFGMYLLAMGSGRPRSEREIVGILTRAGFQSVRKHPTSLPFVVRVISARKPKTYREPLKSVNTN